MKVLSQGKLKYNLTGRNRSDLLDFNDDFLYSGAPAARRAAKWSPILIWERNGNPSVDFLMVIMTSGIARGRVRTTTTATATEPRNMAATPPNIRLTETLQAWFTLYFFDIGHPGYDQLTPVDVKTRYLLTSLT